MAFIPIGEEEREEKIFTVKNSIASIIKVSAPGIGGSGIISIPYHPPS
jgi:hypothetical protein